jgi:hypothetical protein
MSIPFHRFVGVSDRKIALQMSIGQVFLKTGDRLFAVRHRPNQVALVPADVWDLLVDQIAVATSGTADSIQTVTETATIVEVTTKGRIGLGPAMQLLREAGIVNEVQVVGAGPYLVLRPASEVTTSTGSPITDLWDLGWEMLQRARTR